MDPKCFCTDIDDIPDDDLDSEQNIKLAQPNVQISGTSQPQAGTCYFAKLNFGQVTIGSKVTKPLYIQNDTKAVQVYTLQETDTNMMYNPFICKILCKQNAVKPNEIFQCNVTYKPAIPETKSFHKFEIVDASCNKHFISVTGESAAPTVQVSVKYLNFFLTKSYSRMSKKIFELRNTSPSLEIVYQFENYNHNLFTIDNYRGVIPVHGKRFVTVKFHPKVPGNYADKLWCLIKNQEPVVIEIFGMYHPNEHYEEMPLLKRYPIPISHRSGVTGYLQDKISLSKSCLYFENTNFQTLLLTNELHVDIQVKWSENKEHLFEIEPEIITVPPGRSFAISCKFIPKALNKFYAQILSAQIYWAEDLSKTHVGSKLYLSSTTQFASTTYLENAADPICREGKVIHVPFCLALRCVGHTIQKEYHSISLIDISPNIIILPPCAVQMTTSSTFLIKCLGRLPVLYKIIPPSKTYVSMQPMSGVIEAGQYQIVVVQFCPATTESFCIQEEWKISVCGQSENLTPIIIKLQCNLPSLVIGDNNKIRFPCIQAGWKEDLFVYVKNTSIFDIKYTFVIVNNEYLKIEPSQGCIGANEEFYVKMCYTGNPCSPTKTKLICKCQVVHRQLLTGKEYKTIAIVYTKCCYSQLCALPSSEDFGEIKWDTSLKTKFYAFNFGTPSVNFELKPNNIDSEHIKITPNCGTINSGEKVLINVEFTAKIIGENKITISYGMLSSNEGNIDIFTIKFTCVYPVIQVDEITDHNLGPLFSKSVLWELLNIDLLNNKLRTIQHGERGNIVCHIPDFEMSTDLHYVTLLISNNTNFKIDISLQRIKLCNCEAKETKSLSFRKKVYNCPHREMLTLNVSHTEIKANSKGILTVEIKYIQPDLNQLRYIMGLTDDRFIELTVNIYSICKEVSTLSAYKPLCRLEFKDVFIGEMNPPMQLFWVYNNSADSVTYHVGTVELVKLRNTEGFEIMRCLNPVDLVEPYNSRPIVFRFHPVEVQLYSVSVPVLLGDKVIELKISGRGTDECKCPTESNFMPTFSRTPLDSVNISVDKIEIQNLPAWSCTDRVLFIRNNHGEHVFEYEWSDILIEGVLKITTSKKSGSLQPKETHRMYIQISALGEPCVTHAVLSCKLYNLTQYLMYEQSKIVHEKKVEEASHYFTITEKEEITSPVIIQNLVPEPKEFYATIGIDIEIISSGDSHLHTDIDTLFKNKPRRILETDNKKIMEEYEKRLTSIDPPIESFTRKIEEQTKTSKTKSAGDVKMSDINEEIVEVVSHTMTLLIGEVVFSETFKKIVETGETDFTNYYSQYKLAGKCITREPHKKVKLSELRAKETEKFLNYPQAQELGCVIKEMFDEMLDKLQTESGLSTTFLPTL